MDRSLGLIDLTSEQFQKREMISHNPADRIVKFFDIEQLIDQVTKLFKVMIDIIKIIKKNLSLTNSNQ